MSYQAFAAEKPDIFSEHSRNQLQVYLDEFVFRQPPPDTPRCIPGSARSWGRAQTHVIPATSTRSSSAMSVRSNFSASSISPELCLITILSISAINSTREANSFLPSDLKRRVGFAGAGRHNEQYAILAFGDGFN
jgi:hypothetical protein